MGISFRFNAGMILLCAMCFFARPSLAQKAEKYKVYENAEYSFSFRYPASWNLSPGNSPTVVASFAFTTKAMQRAEMVILAMNWEHPTEARSISLQKPPLTINGQEPLYEEVTTDCGRKDADGSSRCVATIAFTSHTLSSRGLEIVARLESESMQEAETAAFATKESAIHFPTERAYLTKLIQGIQYSGY